MPSTKSVFNRKKRSTLRSNRVTSSRCSSMSNAFAATNNLITSSPIPDDDNLMESVFDESTMQLVTLEDYKSEFKNRRENLIKSHYHDLVKLEELIFDLRESVLPEHRNVPLGNITFSVKNKSTSVDLDVSSLSNDTFLMPPRNPGVMENPDTVFKKPLVHKPSKKTINKPPQQRNSKFRTPDVSSQSSRMLCSTKTVTPKMNPNTPMNMMRRPKQGEMAISMTGSPLLVSAIMHDEVPTVSVPFADGRVFSILPNPGSAPEDVPEFDDKIKAYLRTLQDHLKKFCET